jgi:hypothetical protein
MPVSLSKRFAQKYQGDVKDPILRSLLESIGGYQEDLQHELLLSAYSTRADVIPDGMFEVLKRHLFGQMFPGPAYVVAAADLREPATAEPVQVREYHYFGMQDSEGDKILFAPLHDALVIPSFSNDVMVDSDGSDLRLQFNIPSGWLSRDPHGYVSVFCHEVRPIVVERMRGRIERQWPRDSEDTEANAGVRQAYPAVFNVLRPRFTTPYESRLLRVPIGALANGTRNESDATTSVILEGLGQLERQLTGKLTLNTFLLWNVMQGESMAERVDAFRYRVVIANHQTRSTEVVKVQDTGHDPVVEYVSAYSVMDPGYPFQYTTSCDPERGDIYLTVSPPATERVMVRYCQYELQNSCVGLAAGSPLHHHEGVSEQIKTVQSLTPTQRLDVFDDKEMVWDYFRSLLASRNRWLTRNDLRNAVGTFPPFSDTSDSIRKQEITFEERVGRVRGFLTPYTEITIPVDEPDILADPDRSHFERQIGLYLKSRTVHGTFVRVRLVPVGGS